MLFRGQATRRCACNDLLGRQVAVLSEGMAEAGWYSVNFLASGLPSGTYFCRLVSGGFVQTRKMVLMK